MRDRLSKEDAVRMLEELVTLDFDALETYDAALDHIDDESLKGALMDFRRDHERHIEELRPIIKSMGGDPPDDHDGRGTWSKSKVAVADLIGDEAVLKAVHTTAESTHEAYERAAGEPEFPDEVHAMLARSREDEYRHREWLASKLQLM